MKRIIKKEDGTYNIELSGDEILELIPCEILDEAEHANIDVEKLLPENSSIILFKIPLVEENTLPKNSWHREG